MEQPDLLTYDPKWSYDDPRDYYRVRYDVDEWVHFSEDIPRRIVYLVQHDGVQGRLYIESMMFSLDVTFYPRWPQGAVESQLKNIKMWVETFDVLYGEIDEARIEIEMERWIGNHPIVGLPDDLVESVKENIRDIFRDQKDDAFRK